jgi:hypothetical protein
MRKLLPDLLLSLAASAALADYVVLFYNNWYFADVYWPKVLLLVLVLAPLYFLLLGSPWRRLWQALGLYWAVLIALFMLGWRTPDLATIGFTGVLDLEVPMVWLPIGAGLAYAWVKARRRARTAAAAQRGVDRALQLRERLRRSVQLKPVPAGGPAAAAPLLAAGVALEETMTPAELERQPEIELLDADDRTDGTPPRFTVLGLLLAFGLCGLALLPRAVHAEGVDSTEPWHRPDRHAEFKDPSLRWNPQDPGLSGEYPAPLVSRAGEKFSIVIDNSVGGEIRVFKLDSNGKAVLGIEHIGHVLSPATQVSKEGFTASGWAAPGTLCATAVNALHIKVHHDYATGRSWVFSVLPKEFANFDPKNYNSFYAASGAIVTDLPAGSGIFGGLWAPIVGSKVGYYRNIQDEGADAFPPLPATDSYTPSPGDRLIITVTRKQYNPEYIEFENRFGGIVWVKELGLDPYPIAQVLKPVAGAGRFGGSEYAGRGRIRANHPGVICISTSDKGDIGGFQIIPRDHSMSPEMTYARTKTQWMVVGPLWAFDKSWEGLPPLFSDYIYPAYVPLDGRLPDGEQVNGAQVFLSRCTVRARYSDSPHPEEYELLRETRPLTFEALKDMTNLRIYFPRE